MTGERGVGQLAHGSEVSEWEWCRKRLINNGARGSAPYHPWWGLFMDSVPLGKRHVTEDLRYINKVAPVPVKQDKAVSSATRNKGWLQVR